MAMKAAVTLVYRRHWEVGTEIKTKRALLPFHWDVAKRSLTSFKNKLFRADTSFFFKFLGKWM